MGLTVITGGGGDFGRAVGIAFGRSGPVLLTNRSVKKLEDNLEIMQSMGIECRAMQLDTSDRDSCFACARAAQAYAQELNTEVTAVVNLAALSGNYQPGCKAMDQFAITALGPVNITDAFYDVLSSGAAMIHFASMAGHNLPMFNEKFTDIYKTCGESGFQERMYQLLRAIKPDLPENAADMTDADEKGAYGRAYVLAKNFVLWYARANIMKFAKKNMRILTISPGTHLTRHIREMTPEKAKEQMSQNPLHRWGSPADMAETCVYLCSENAKYFTGCDILVDGGATNARFVQQLS